MPNANVDHAISGQGTADSTLDYSATTPRVNIYNTLKVWKIYQEIYFCNIYHNIYNFKSYIIAINIEPIFIFEVEHNIELAHI